MDSLEKVTENITDVDYRHAKRIYKQFDNSNLGNYHDSRNKYIEIYKLDPPDILPAPELAIQGCLEKTVIGLGLLNNV